MLPNAVRRGPAVPVAMTEPRVRLSPGGSAAIHVPWSARRPRNSSQRIPVWAVATRSVGLRYVTLDKRFVESTRSAGESGGSHEPEPSIRTFQPAAEAARSTMPTASSLPGKTCGCPDPSTSTTPSVPRSERRRRRIISSEPATTRVAPWFRPRMFAPRERTAWLRPPAMGS